MVRKSLKSLITSLGENVVGKSMIAGLFEPTVNEMLKREHGEKKSLSSVANQNEKYINE